jgi:formate hydrogenlyase transcriptional activator
MSEPLSRQPAGDAERYRTLLEITNALVANHTREALFAAIAGALRRVVSFERTAIFLHDPARDVLRLFVLESSLPTSYFAVGLEIPSTESHVGLVFRQQRPFVRRDLAREQSYPAEAQALADGVRSFVIVPLVVRAACIGTLAVASTRVDAYTDADVTFLQEVAAQVAVALANMTAYERIAALTARLERENAYLQEEIHGEHDFGQMVGASEALLAVIRRVEKVAPTDSTVLITGETGTGKELIARAIHHQSARRTRALVKVNCSAISAGLVESEFFGHVKGAFTGALERRVGRFQLADGGTIFLDEVGELPLETQVKLLRVLQEHELEPVGSNQTMTVDVRVIAATNRDLAAAVEAGRFRADLFYRLNVVPVEVPPLRERRADIPQLTMFFLARYSRRFGKRVETVSPDTMARLVAYDWPGNIRELQNVVERAVVLAPGSVLELDDNLLRPRPAPSPSVIAAPAAAVTTGTGHPAPGAGLAEMLEEVERAQITAALQRSGGVIEGPRGAAGALKLHPNTLRSRMEKLGIRRTGPDGASG